MKTDKAAFDHLQSLLDDSVHQCTEKEKELLAIKEGMTEIQHEKLTFVKKVQV